MLVSIVIPIFQSEKYIEKCARSLFEQTFKDIEYIFVDDASQDKSVEVLQRVIEDYPERKPMVKVIRHTENKGSAMARSAGLHKATGDYVIQVDSDDYTSKDYISCLALKAEESKADIVICDFYYVYANGKTKKFVFTELCEDVDASMANVLSGKMHNSLCNKLIRLSMFAKHDIDFIEGVNMFDDKSVVFKALYYSKKVVAVNKPLYYYNKNNPNSITSQSKVKAIPSALQVVEEIDDFFKGKEMSSRVHLAIDHFKIGIKGLILFYSMKEEDYDNELMKTDFKTASILSHPTIPIYYKFIIIAHQWKLRSIESLIRRLLFFFKNKL